MKGSEIPICELSIHTPYDEVVKLHDDFKNDLFGHGERCTIEVSRVLRMEPKKQDLLLGSSDLSLCIRVRESGGFSVVKGAAEIICNNEGLPLVGTCCREPEPFRTTLWCRSFKKPIFILRATSEYSGGDEMINKAAAEEAGDVWKGNTKESNLIGVYSREVPPEWRNFMADTGFISSQLVDACESTREVQLTNYSAKALEFAIEACFDKSKCEACNHTHYGLIRVREGEVQPMHNRTKTKAIEKIARYNPNSEKYFRKVRSMNRS
jgi:hypothetical protein